MFATYASALALAAASVAIGSGVLAACGWRRFSWLAAAVGLAVVCAVAWGTARLGGEGLTPAIALAGLALAGGACGRRLEGFAGALREGLPLMALALAVASIPFLVEGRFGILGTSFNPDMSQHLLAADRLAAGVPSQLEEQGYPLGPHAIAVALHDGLGIGLVQAFGGLTLAVAALASLTALAALGGSSPGRRIGAALLVGLPYLVVSSLAQGAFKETMQALFVLAFAIGLLQLSRDRARTFCAVPLAALAAGSLFTYSFPGLAWPAVTLALWATAQLAWGAGTSRAALRPAALAAALLAVLTLPELARILDFRDFETFDPEGPGLGNLFGQVSPLAALGIWPSGDFRLDSGAGAVPAIVFYLGAVLGAVLLVTGLLWCARQRLLAVPASLTAALGIYLAARIAGTPYQAAKALVMLAPLAALIIVTPLAEAELPSPRRLGLRVLAGALYVAAAGGCAALALANGPVGPASYSPRLTSLRPLLAEGSTLVLAPREFLDEEHGRPFLAWELRGGRVCIRVRSQPSQRPPPPGVRFVITEAGLARPFSGLAPARQADPYLLWERRGGVEGPGNCPRIAVRQARQGR